MNLDFSNFFNLPFFTFFKKLLGIGAVALLPADGRQARPLTIVVSIMCGLGCLAAISASIGFRAANNWTQELKSAMTILIEAPRDEAAINRAVQIAMQTQGVASASAMSKAKAKELLKNYGANIGALLDELPLPNLIEIGLKPNIDGTSERLAANLNAQGYKFEIDDHSRYSGEIVRTSAVLRGAALVSLGLLMIAAISSIAFAARAALQTRHEAVEILHLVGAEDNFVAKEVQTRFMRLGLVAGAYGAIGAAILIIIAASVMRIGASNLTSGSHLLKWYDVWILFAAPIISAMASAIAARYAARQTLKEMV
ncbi:MAG: hypothetical protein J0L55_17220 [Caulobacterales bacterium]|nr:hypothetical protein [Caulobacterales bacterium]